MNICIHLNDGDYADIEYISDYFNYKSMSNMKST